MRTINKKRLPYGANKTRCLLQRYGLVIREIYNIGELFRWTFTIVVAGFVITDSGEDSFVPIDKVVWDIFDVPVGETPDEAVLIKSVTRLEPVTAWDTPVPWWDQTGQKWDP